MYTEAKKVCTTQTDAIHSSLFREQQIIFSSSRWSSILRLNYIQVGKLLKDLAALVNHVINTNCLKTASEFILFLCLKAQMFNKSEMTHICMHTCSEDSPCLCMKESRLLELEPCLCIYHVFQHHSSLHSSNKPAWKKSTLMVWYLAGFSHHQISCSCISL